MTLGIAKYVFSITRKLCVCLCVQTVTCDNGQAPRCRQRGHRRSHRLLYSIHRLKSAPEPGRWDSKPSDALKNAQCLLQRGWKFFFVFWGTVSVIYWSDGNPSLYLRIDLKTWRGESCPNPTPSFFENHFSFFPFITTFSNCSVSFRFWDYKSERISRHSLSCYVCHSSYCYLPTIIICDWRVVFFMFCWPRMSA